IAVQDETEAVTIHDFQAGEYFIVCGHEMLVVHCWDSLVHFAFTTEDIHNVTYALCVRGAISQVCLLAAHNTVDAIEQVANTAIVTSMLSRTHGQPATPTILGKELAVFVHRLKRQLHRISIQQYMGKLNGATGTYAAHVAAVPHANWPVI